MSPCRESAADHDKPLLEELQEVAADYSPEAVVKGAVNLASGSYAAVCMGLGFYRDAACFMGSTLAAAASAAAESLGSAATGAGQVVVHSGGFYSAVVRRRVCAFLTNRAVPPPVPAHCLTRKFWCPPGRRDFSVGARASSCGCGHHASSCGRYRTYMRALRIVLRRHRGVLSKVGVLSNGTHWACARAQG
eukprot:SAG31_NODE_801_length_12013_cov_23.812070_6_plen_191_part_00